MIPQVEDAALGLLDTVHAYARIGIVLDMVRNLVKSRHVLFVNGGHSVTSQGSFRKNLVILVVNTPLFTFRHTNTSRRRERDTY